MPNDPENSIPEGLVPEDTELVADTDADTDEAELTSGDFACKMLGCDNPGTEICPKCKSPYCPEHGSEVDPDFCFACLLPSQITLVKEPLKDEDGVTHEGAKLTPTGPGFKTLFQRIVDMTEEQLRTHIRMWQDKVEEAQRVLDYRRIALGSCQIQLEEKEAANRRKLKGVKVTSTGNRIGVSASGAAGSQDAKAKKLADALKSMGVTSTGQAEAFLRKLAAAAALRPKQNGVKK